MKRFTETTKWKDPWFRKLPPHLKTFWQFLLDIVDNAGVWDPDLEHASFFIGHEVTEDEIMERFNNGKGRIEVLPGGKWFLPQFIEFQYGELNPRCYPHQKVRELVIRHGIESRVGGKVVTYPMRSKGHTLKEEEEELSLYITELIGYWNNTKLPKIQTISKERRGKLSARWRSQHFRKYWKEAIDKMNESAFCLGESKSGWRASIDWFIANDTNYLKALEGKYDNKAEDRFSSY